MPPTPPSARPYLATVPLASFGSQDESLRLPTPLSSLVGREHELAAVGALLRDPAVRLVTLTGPGGVGKTRLALRLAADLAGEGCFADGAAFVELATVRDPDHVASTIAQSLGVRGLGQEPAETALRSFLRSKDLLMVVDNFEQVLSAAPLAATLLGACPDLAILVTSRERLHLDGERVVPVSPLTVPAPDEAATAAATADAVRLFVERAQAVDPSFTLAEGDAPAVGEICRLLDGLPLAIELAATRIRHLPLVTLRDRLQRRLPLLTGGSRDRPGRLRTMRDAISWSHDLLGPEEKALFRRLSVFVGGCTLEAAEHVGGRRGTDGNEDDVLPPSSLSVLDGLAALIDASLLRHEAGPDGTARYLMLETIHEYASEQLAASDEADAVRRAHAAHYLALAERYELAELLPDGERVVALLEAEHANLRAALAWLEAAGERGPFLRLAAALGRYWTVQARYHEGRSWLERALAHGGASGMAERAKALVHLGMIEAYRWANREAETYLTAGLEGCRAQGDALLAAEALLGLGGLANLEGDHDRAAALLEECRVAAQAVADRRLAGITEGWALANLAVADRTHGNLALAAARLEEALRLMREAGYTTGTILALGDLGDLARDRGEHARALGLYREALGLVRGNPGTRSVIDAIAGVAMVAAAVRQAERGARLLGAAEARREQVGLRYRVAENQVALERAVAAARATLGEEAFAAAWAAGRSLRPAQAVAEALDPFEPRASLTPRETEVLKLLAAGLTDADIAGALFISVRTVEHHVSHILAKLGVKTRAAAAVVGRDVGLVPPESAPPA